MICTGLGSGEESIRRVVTTHHPRGARIGSHRIALAAHIAKTNGLVQ